MAIWIMNFPLPPSQNSAFGMNGRVVFKTKKHRQFRDNCHLWAATNRSDFGPALESIKHDFARMTKLHGFASFRVDCWFAIFRSRLFNTSGGVLAFDDDNRLKPVRDGLAAILEIDDRHFFAGNCEKVIADQKEDECTVIRIAPARPRTLEQIRQEMKRDTRMPSTAGF